MFQHDGVEITVGATCAQRNVTIATIILHTQNNLYECQLRVVAPKTNKCVLQYLLRSHIDPQNIFRKLNLKLKTLDVFAPLFNKFQCKRNECENTLLKRTVQQIYALKFTNDTNDCTRTYTHTHVRAILCQFPQHRAFMSRRAVYFPVHSHGKLTNLTYNIRTFVKPQMRCGKR